MTPDDGASMPRLPATADDHARSGVCAIAVMAKAPVAGRNKTRLHPAVSPEAATRLHAAFLRDITATIRHAGECTPIEGFVAYAPAGSEALFDRAESSFEFRIGARQGRLVQPGETQEFRVMGGDSGQIDFTQAPRA